jgi:hypothetical protein
MMLRLAIALLAIALIVAGFLGVGGLEDLPSEAGTVLLLVFVILRRAIFPGPPVPQAGFLSVGYFPDNRSSAALAALVSWARGVP